MYLGKGDTWSIPERTAEQEEKFREEFREIHREMRQMAWKATKFVARASLKGFLFAAGSDFYDRFK